MVCIDRGATVGSASKLMREADVDELLVTQRVAGCADVFTVGDVLSCNG